MFDRNIKGCLLVYIVVFSGTTDKLVTSKNIINLVLVTEIQNGLNTNPVKHYYVYIQGITDNI